MHRLIVARSEVLASIAPFLPATSSHPPTTRPLRCLVAATAVIHTDLDTGYGRRPLEPGESVVSPIGVRNPLHLVLVS